MREVRIAVVTLQLQTLMLRFDMPLQSGIRTVDFVTLLTRIPDSVVLDHHVSLQIGVIGELFGANPAGYFHLVMHTLNVLFQ